MLKRLDIRRPAIWEKWRQHADEMLYTIGRVYSTCNWYFKHNTMNEQQRSELAR